VRPLLRGFEAEVPLAAVGHGQEEPAGELPGPVAVGEEGRDLAGTPSVVPGARPRMLDAPAARVLHDVAVHVQHDRGLQREISDRVRTGGTRGSRPLKSADLPVELAGTPRAEGGDGYVSLTRGVAAESALVIRADHDGGKDGERDQHGPDDGTGGRPG
jgi:hypothetical protein